MEGKLSDVEWHNKAFTAEQIKSTLQESGSIKGSLKGHWLKNGKPEDASGNRHNGTPHGNPRENNDGPPRKRSELRRADETQPSPALLGNKEAVLVFPFDNELVRSYVQRHIPIPGTRVVFISRPGGSEDARSAFGHLEKIYGFRILEADTDVSELRPGSLELNNILQRARAAFGTTELGIPVIFLKDGSLAFEARAGKGAPLTQEFLQKTRAFRLRYNQERFIQDASYQEAHLLAGSALSQGFSSWFNGPVATFRGNDLVFTDSFLDSIIQNLESLTASLRSA
jgi:hypothetical protein